MRPRRLSSFVLIAAALAWPAAAQEPGTPPSAEAMMALALERSKPGPEHELLDVLAGAWTQEVRYSFPGMPGFTFTGSAENRWILGGRFLESRFAGDGPARAFEGVMIYGYDTRRKQHFAVGMDTGGTYYINPFGRYDAAAKRLVLEGDELDETGGGKFHYKILIRPEGPDRHVAEFVFEFPGREPAKVMEIVSTRRR